MYQYIYNVSLLLVVVVVVVVVESGVLFTSGDGRHGKLALGDENLANHFNPTVVTRFKSLFVEQVLCIGVLCCALKHYGRLSGTS